MERSLKQNFMRVGHSHRYLLRNCEPRKSDDMDEILSRLEIWKPKDVGNVRYMK